MLKKIINGEEIYFTEPGADNIVMGRQLEEEILGQGALYQQLKLEEASSGLSSKSKSGIKHQPQRKPYNNVISLKRKAMNDIAKSIDKSITKP